MKLSIIIPVYNSSQYLQACLDSCLNQYPFLLGADYEIICVNDGSTDESSSILNSYLRNGIIILNQKNSGVSIARNAGIDQAIGDYIWFVDSDDVIRPNVLKQVIDALNDSKSVGLCFNMLRVDNDYICEKRSDLMLNYTSEKIDVPTHVPVTIILSRNYITKNQIKFKEKMTISEDTLFRFYVSLYSDNFIYSNDILYYYRYVPNSAIHVKMGERMFINTMMLLKEYVWVYENWNDLHPVMDKRHLKDCINWAVQNVLMSGLFVNTGMAKESLTFLKQKGLYPYSILWKRFWGQKGQRKANLIALLFPFEPYYIILLKVFSVFRRPNSNIKLV